MDHSAGCLVSAPAVGATRRRTVGQLYEALGGRLVAQVHRRAAGVCRATVEDACQDAWIALIRNCRELDDERVAYAYLTTCAIRAAWKQQAKAGRAGDEVPESIAGRTNLEATVIARDTLQFAQASGRQRRLLWLSALGFSYTEMSGLTGDTVRTVDRQLQRGRRAIAP